MSLKDRVKKAISHKACEIADLARAAKVRSPSVHGWLNGTSQSMKAGPAIRAAAYLGIDALWLAEGEGEMLSGKTYSHTAMVSNYSVREADPLPALEAELLVHARAMNDRGLILLIDQAEQIAARHPKAIAKAA